jgi:hypothetical protein
VEWREKIDVTQLTKKIDVTQLRERVQSATRTGISPHKLSHRDTVLNSMIQENFHRHGRNATVTSYCGPEYLIQEKSVHQHSRSQSVQSTRFVTWF